MDVLDVYVAYTFFRPGPQVFFAVLEDDLCVQERRAALVVKGKVWCHRMEFHCDSGLAGGPTCEDEEVIPFK